MSGRLGYAGVDGQDISQAGEGEYPLHPGLRRGEPQLTVGEAGESTPAR
jgi:hypothetical protein